MLPRPPRGGCGCCMARAWLENVTIFGKPKARGCCLLRLGQTVRWRWGRCWGLWLAKASVGCFARVAARWLLGCCRQVLSTVLRSFTPV